MVDGERAVQRRGVRTARVSLLEADPELGRSLDPRALAQAERELVVPIRTLRAGAWCPDAESVEADTFGLLVFDGLMRRRTVVGGRASSELLGPGDVLRPWDAAGDRLVRPTVQWHSSAPMLLALLDGRFVRTAAAWPAVMAELVARLERQNLQLGLRMALAEVSGVELRVQLLLWHLADRWGRPEAGGVALPISPDQATLAEMAGLSRGRVNAALGALQDAGSLTRRPRGWLLCGPRPAQLLGEGDRQAPDGRRVPVS